MRDRIRAPWKLKAPELMIGGMVLAFVIGGLVWGTSHRVYQVCSGLVRTECPPDDWIELNPAAGLLAAALAFLAFLVLNQVMTRRRG